MKRQHCVAVFAAAWGVAAMLLPEHSSLSAQTGSWLVRFSNVDVRGVAADRHGGAYATGIGIWDGDYQSFVRRLNAAGTELWTHHFRLDPESLGLFDAAATADGVVVVGGGPDAFICTYDAAGRVLWSRHFGTAGGDLATDVAVAPNGNIYVSGHLANVFPQYESADAFIRQYDAFGNEGWTQRFGDAISDDSALGLALAPDETIFVGSVTSFLFGQRPFLSAFDRLGTQLFSRQVEQLAVSAAATTDSVFVAGQYPCIQFFCPPSFRGTLSRYDRSGIALWTLTPGLYRPAGGVAVDDSGNAYIAGFSSVDRPRPESADRLTVVSYDPNGIERMRFRFDEPGGEFVRQVDVGPAGEVLVGGTGYAGFVAKIDFDSPELRVSIDIRPGSPVNPINLSSNGVVPVAILTAGSFDATAVVATSVCFGDWEDAAQRNCTEAHGGGHVEDADKDGDLDLVLHFEFARTGIDRGDTRACLTGQTHVGTVITGCDAIVVR